MRGYRRHAVFVALFLAGYVLLGNVFRFTRPGGEVFPVSSWTLFLYVPNQVTEYAVEVLSVGERRLEPPRSFHEARDLFPGSGDVRADRVIHQLGRALDADDAARLAELRELFEKRWIGDAHGPVAYRVVRRRYQPIERWKTGAFQDRQALAEFDFAPEAS